jgi:hypothetical protein
MDFIKDWWDVITGSFIAAFLVGGFFQTSREHGARITAHDAMIKELKDGKVDQTECGMVQLHNSERFIEWTKDVDELKKLIKESNDLHQKHHDSLVKIMIESNT